MMEEVLEVKTLEGVKKLIDFAINAFTADEHQMYEKLGNFDKVLSEVKKLDIFNESLVYKYITSGQIKAYKVMASGEIDAACALDERSGRMLFFLERKTDKPRNSAKKLIDYLESKMNAPLAQGEYSFTILAFINGAKKLERLGFNKLKSEIVLNGVKYTALRYTQEQPDIQNY